MTLEARMAIEALRAGDLPALGRLLDASHASLRDDFDVSIAAVDRLVAAAQATPGVLGARMMGGGFGGAVIALASTDVAEAALAMIRKRHPDAPDGFVCRVVDGAGEISP